MQTRQKSRRNINVPGRYFTGSGEPVDVVLRDISEGGCRFPVGAAQLRVGSAIQIFVGGFGPYRGKVRWIEDGEAGINFDRPLTADTVEQFKNSHVHSAAQAASSGEFAPMSTAAPTQPGAPRRFC